MPSTLYNADGSRTGRRINAKVRRAHAMSGGRGNGPLSERRPKTEEEEAAAEIERARRDFAAMSAPAQPQAQTAPVKPEGMLVPGPGGSSVWRTKEQLDAEKQLRESRAAARRKGVNMKPAAPPAQFSFPKLDGRPRSATFQRFAI